MAQQVQGQSMWANLPKEIVEALGLQLDATGWANSRLTCKHWSNVTHGISLLEIDLERNAHRWMMVLTCVARLFPRLNSIALLCGSRITPEIFAERMAALSITSIQLQELELRFLYLSNPRLGNWLEDLSGVTELRGLRLLRLAGGATPTPAVFEALVALKQLRVLEVLPGVYGQIAGYDMDVGQGDADSHPIGHMGVGDAHLSAIGKLTQLQQVTVKVCPQETTPAGLAGLTALGLLDNLEHLALYDAELPCDSLAQHLAGATRLSSLQFGLNSVSPELGTLKNLPKLQEVGLDTAFLPSLQELVTTAKLGKIPQQGPGSITSLCLLDQTVADSQQLACLSQLKSLAELVLVNPLVQITQQQAAPPSPAAHLQQQQQGPVDISALAGLTSLRLLQVDLGLKSGAASVAEGMQPWSLMVTEHALRQLAEVWTALETLDLSGFGPEMLPESALAVLSCFTSLRALSVLHPENADLPDAQDDDFDGDQIPEPPLLPGLGVAAMPQPPAAAPGGGGSNGSGGSDASKQRSMPWWTLPTGLMSLCLSHMDLTGKGVTQCGGQRQQCSSSSSGSSSSCCCCLAPAVAGSQQQKQQLLPGLGLGLSLFQSRPSPLRPLSKRRRQTQQRMGSGEIEAAELSAAVAGCSEDGSAALAAGNGDSAREQSVPLVSAPLCSCATVLPAQFASLQALWLEHVLLPPSFLRRVLPTLSTSMESLALLHVGGTQAEDMTSLGALTALTSLRLIPSDHDVGGLEPLLPMKHLKKLGLKLTHLRPSDLSVLHKLRSLFCLSLSAPCVNGALYPGFASAVRLQQIEDVVQSSLPYCDLELQPEPNMAAMP